MNSCTTYFMNSLNCLCLKMPSIMFNFTKSWFIKVFGKNKHDSSKSFHLMNGRFQGRQLPRLLKYLHIAPSKTIFLIPYMHSSLDNVHVFLPKTRITTLDMGIFLSFNIIHLMNCTTNALNDFNNWLALCLYLNRYFKYLFFFFFSTIPLILLKPLNLFRYLNRHFKYLFLLFLNAIPMFLLMPCICFCGNFRLHSFWASLIAMPLTSRPWRKTVFLPHFCPNCARTGKLFFSFANEWNGFHSFQWMKHSFEKMNLLSCRLKDSCPNVLVYQLAGLCWAECEEPFLSSVVGSTCLKSFRPKKLSHWRN